MEIVFIASVATLGVCAVLARRGKRPTAEPLRGDSHDPLDQALFHLINEVSRGAEPYRSPYVRHDAMADHVMVDSRIRALDKEITRV